MVFAGIGFWTALALAAASAGALALLHLLRVRPRELRVVTTLFWAHAAERTRARTLLERFRHPLTYALLLTFCLLSILALTEPRRVKESVDRRYEVIALDGGISMGAVDVATGASRFDAAREAALAEAERLSSDDPLAVLVADPWPRLVHSFDDPRPLLSGRLAAIAPADLPAARDDLLRLAASLLEGKQNPRLIWVTDRNDEALPPAVDVIDVGKPVENAAIVSALFEPGDENPLRGRFTVRVGSGGTSSRDVTVRVDRGGGAPLLSETRSLLPGTTADFTLPDLPADGDELVVRIEPDDAVRADNRAKFRLPLRTPIRVGGPGAVPDVLRIAMSADPTVEWVGPDGLRDVAVTVAGDGPAVSASGPVVVASGLLHGLDMEGATCGAGGSLTAGKRGQEPLLVSGDAVLAAMSSRPGAAELHLSTALLAPDSDVCRRPTFAVFVARSLRALAGWDEDPVVLAPERLVEDPLWAQREAFDGLVTAMPGSRSDVRERAGGENVKETPPVARRWATPRLLEVVLILALAMFVAEAALHARGRIS